MGRQIHVVVVRSDGEVVSGPVDLWFPFDDDGSDEAYEFFQRHFLGMACEAADMELVDDGDDVVDLRKGFFLFHYTLLAYEVGAKEPFLSFREAWCLGGDATNGRHIRVVLATSDGESTTEPVDLWFPFDDVSSDVAQAWFRHHFLGMVCVVEDVRPEDVSELSPFDYLLLAFEPGNNVPFVRFREGEQW